MPGISPTPARPKTSLTVACRHLLSRCGPVMVILCVLATGCRQKDLVYPQELCKLNVRFVWDNAEKASLEGMTLLFYPQDPAGEFWRFEIPGRDGGSVEIPAGEYTLIAVNNDLPDVVLTDMPYSLASLTALDALYARSYASPTGMVYEGKVGNISVAPDKVSYRSYDNGCVVNSPPEIYCYPDSLSTVYNVVVDQIQRLELAKSVEGILSGCAHGTLLSTGSPIPPAVAIPFEMDIDTDKEKFTGTTTGFADDSPGARYILTLRVHYVAGGGYEKILDVTDAVENSFYPHNVYIHITGLTLPEEPTIDTDEVGMKVDVDGWHMIDINLDSKNY